MQMLSSCTASPYSLPFTIILYFSINLMNSNLRKQVKIPEFKPIIIQHHAMVSPQSPIMWLQNQQSFWSHDSKPAKEHSVKLSINKIGLLDIIKTGVLHIIISCQINLSRIDCFIFTRLIAVSVLHIVPSNIRRANYSLSQSFLFNRF